MRALPNQMSERVTRVGSCPWQACREGRGVCEAGDQAEPRLSYPGPDAVDEGELQQRRIDRALMDQLLHLVQELRALLMAEVGGLLCVERIDLGIVAISIGAALDSEGREARRGVAEGGAGGLNEPFELLVGIALEKRCPLERAERRADAYRLQIVEHRL